MSFFIKQQKVRWGCQISKTGQVAPPFGTLLTPTLHNFQSQCSNCEGKFKIFTLDLDRCHARFNTSLHQAVLFFSFLCPPPPSTEREWGVLGTYCFWCGSRRCQRCSLPALLSPEPIDGFGPNLHKHIIEREERSG